MKNRCDISERIYGRSTIKASRIFSGNRYQRVWSAAGRIKPDGTDPDSRGWPPTAEVLRTATINAAKMLGREKVQGTVESGELADLVVLDADPLSDIRNITKIHRVIKGGVIYDPIQLLQPEM